MRKTFLEFFKERKHVIVPSSSLAPDDPSVLLTTAGMQQFKQYYTGADPLSVAHKTLGNPIGALRAASVQKSFRTSDIEAVGDESHLTFFEMLGNFSFGDYFKQDAISWAHEFITKKLGLLISYVTVFGGEKNIPADEESKQIWESLDVSDIRLDNLENVFWGPTGKNGPCGPSTEIYCKNSAGHDVEVWNIVFNEYFCSGSRDDLLIENGADPIRGPLHGSRLKRLASNGVDTGMGLERLAMIVQEKASIFETDLFAQYIEICPNNMDEKKCKIIVDHLRGSVFLLADGVRSSNKEAGYILRRLLRRAFVYEYQTKLPEHAFGSIAHGIIHDYGEFYPELLKESEHIQTEILQEREKFLKTLKRGMEALERVSAITGKIAFDLYQSFGLPPEVIREFKNFDWKEFEEAKSEHVKISGAGAEKKFGGHGILLNKAELKAKDEKELAIVTRLHTATHLLQAALRKILGDSVHQMGSDITAERTRFDFSFERKLTADEINSVENFVNSAISRGLGVKIDEMPYEEAIKLGALHFMKEKYPPIVKVYSIGDFKADPPEIFSREFCGGPHVKNTKEIGRFRIIKEEAVSTGVRRVRARVE